MHFQDPASFWTLSTLQPTPLIRLGSATLRCGNSWSNTKMTTRGPPPIGGSLYTEQVISVLVMPASKHTSVSRIPRGVGHSVKLSLLVFLKSLLTKRRTVIRSTLKYFPGFEVMAFA